MFDKVNSCGFTFESQQGLARKFKNEWELGKGSKLEQK